MVRLGSSSLIWVAGLAATTVLLLSADTAEGGRRRQSSDKRDGKFLSIFQIVRFENEACEAGDKNGTCYTAAECDDRGGTNDGSCADGFGVCCTFTLNCGESSNENCTYFESNNIMAGGCQAEFCPCGDNICQMRLDFVNFVISGPSTSDTSVTQLTNGAPLNGGATGVSENGQCLTDTFSVVTASGTKPPVICGTNSGEHMYVDAGKDCCNTLSFTFGRQGVGTSTTNRAFNIKVTQYSCDFINLAPQGCTQYFYGQTTDNVQSYNFDNGAGQHLANQDQAICVRRERGNCRICWYAVNVIDFAVSGVTGTAIGIANGAQCCDYAADATKGYDCVQIPGAMSNGANAAPKESNICGRSVGLVTVASQADVAQAKSVCSTLTPFILNFRTDAYEVQATEAQNADRGFRLGYTMDSINC